MATNPDNKVSVAPGAVMLGSKPTLISVPIHRSPNNNNHTSSSLQQQPQLRFLIMDAPRPTNLHLYIKECRKHSVTDVVRVCEPTYSASGLESAGMDLHEMPYPDGHSPPKDVLDRWLHLVNDRFFLHLLPNAQQQYQLSTTGGGVTSTTTTTPVTSTTNGVTTSTVSKPSSSSSGVASSSSTTPTIAVHCVAGLGRAPVLVAIALIEFANMDPVEAVTFIRQHRRGAINDKQLIWLEQYKRSFKTSQKSGGDACCVVM